MTFPKKPFVWDKLYELTCSNAVAYVKNFICKWKPEQTNIAIYLLNMVDLSRLDYWRQSISHLKNPQRICKAKTSHSKRYKTYQGLLLTITVFIKYQFLPPAYVVYGKVIFQLCLSVCLGGLGCSKWTSLNRSMWWRGPHVVEEEIPSGGWGGGAVAHTSMDIRVVGLQLKGFLVIKQTVALKK